MFTVHERPGQTWIWVPEATHAFLPATIIEVSKVSGAHTASSHVWYYCDVGHCFVIHPAGGHPADSRRCTSILPPFSVS